MHGKECVGRYLRYWQLEYGVLLLLLLLLLLVIRMSWLFDRCFAMDLPAI